MGAQRVRVAGVLDLPHVEAGHRDLGGAELAQVEDLDAGQIAALAMDWAGACGGTETAMILTASSRRTRRIAAVGSVQRTSC